MEDQDDVRISVIMTCKGRWDVLKRTLPIWFKQSPDQIVVVDYNCPERTSARLEAAVLGKNPDIDLSDYRDRLDVLRLSDNDVGQYFNLSKARNAGAMLSRHPYLLFVDADVTPTSGAISQIRRQLSQPGRRIDLIVSDPRTCDISFMDKPPRKLFTCDFWRHRQCLMTHALFREVGGYQARHDGYGGESYDIYIRVAEHAKPDSAGRARCSDGARRCGYQIDVFEPTPFRHAAHSNESRSRFLTQPLGDSPDERIDATIRSIKSLTVIRNRNGTRADPGNRFSESRLEQPREFKPRSYRMPSPVR